MICCAMGIISKEAKEKAIKYQIHLHLYTEQTMGSRIDRRSTVVALTEVPIMHLSRLYEALQWLMQPIKCRQQ